MKQIVILEGRPRRLQLPWRPGRDLVQAGGPALGALLVLSLGLLVLLSGGIPSASSDQGGATTAPLAQSVTRALGGDSTRVVRAGLTTWGDLSVEFVLRDADNAPASRAAALADTLAIGRAVYEGPEPRPLTVTLIGLAPLPAPAAGRVPVLYASLPADRLSGLDWTRVSPDDLPVLAGVRWLPTGVCQAWDECA
jgi:enamine deaminase RidA (YjgF/YER057c/UK114 family)